VSRPILLPWRTTLCFCAAFLATAPLRAAEVRIQVVPLVVPLAGDWDDDGVTDLGWFHGAFEDAFFFGVDPLAGGFLGRFYACGRLPLSGGGAGWMPFAGDWDGNGQAEIGVFDPGGREYVLFRREPGTGDWVEQRRFFHPVAGQGGVPVAGDWNGDRKDEVGLYLDDEKRFQLLAIDEDQAVVRHDLTFQGLPDASSWRPVAGHWGGDGGGVDTLALWNPVTRDLVYRTQNTSGPPQDWPFEIGGPAGPLPFAGDWGFSVSIGFYDPDGAGSGEPLFVIYPWDFFSSDLGGEPILLPPPEDPLVTPCVQ
jgi:hypothetical protein